jgi:hypothetical protein
MTQGKDGSWAVILVLIVFIMLPIGWLIVTYTAEPYHVVSGETLREAVQAAAGITVVNATDTTWPIGGAVGGKTYTLSDESGNVYTIYTQTFDSDRSRDAAVQLYNSQSIGRGKPVGKLIVIGNYLVYVQPYTSGILKKIAPELKKLKAM